MIVENFFKDMRRIRWLLSQLTPREQSVLRFRWGFYYPKKRTRTLEETGKHFGVTRERIRQVETKALQKIKSAEEADSRHK